MTAVEHKSDFELTKDPISRASYGVLSWGSEVNYIVITPSHCIWIFLKYNSLRSNDASASYIIIGEIMASHLLGTRALSKPIVPKTYCQFDTWNKRGGGQGVSTPYPRGSSPLISPNFSSLPPPPYFLFFGYPRPNSDFFATAPAHLTPPPPILRQKPPSLPIYQKLCKLDESIMLIFVSEKNRPLPLAKGVWKCRLRNVGSLGSTSVSD